MGLQKLRRLFLGCCGASRQNMSEDSPEGFYIKKQAEDGSCSSKTVDNSEQGDGLRRASEAHHAVHEKKGNMSEISYERRLAAARNETHSSSEEHSNDESSPKMEKSVDLTMQSATNFNHQKDIANTKTDFLEPKRATAAAAAMNENTTTFPDAIISTKAAAAENEDNSSTDRDISDDSCPGDVTPVTQITRQLTKLSIVSSSDDTVSSMPNGSPPRTGMSAQHLAELMLSPRRTLRVSRKRIRSPPRLKAKSRQLADTLNKQHSPEPNTDVAELTESTATAAATNESKQAFSKVSVTNAPPHSVQHNTVPSVSTNPHEFWQVFPEITVQLGPHLRSLGPDVPHPHNWETHGFICRFLFPSFKDDNDDRRPIPMFETFEARPVMSHQVPLSQKAFTTDSAPSSAPLPAIQQQPTYPSTASVHHNDGTANNLK